MVMRIVWLVLDESVDIFDGVFVVVFYGSDGMGILCLGVFVVVWIGF